jgi:hypothetical protein
VLPISGTVYQRRDQLFHFYVEQMLLRRTPNQQYTPERTVRSLGWLARQMVRLGQTVFYVDGLELQYLEEWERHSIGSWYGLLVGLASGVIFGMVGGRLAFEMGTGRVSAIIFGVVFGVIAGLFVGPISRNDFSGQGTVEWSWLKFWRLVLARPAGNDQGDEAERSAKGVDGIEAITPLFGVDLIETVK